MTSSTANSTGAMRQNAKNSQLPEEEYSEPLAHDEGRESSPILDEQQPARTPLQTRSRAKSCRGQVCTTSVTRPTRYSLPTSPTDNCLQLRHPQRRHHLPRTPQQTAPRRLSVRQWRVYVAGALKARQTRVTLQTGSAKNQIPVLSAGWLGSCGGCPPTR